MDARIFDADGNELSVAEVIHDFIIARAERYDVDVEDVAITMWFGHTTKVPFIATHEVRDNGYDGIEMPGLGEDIKVIKKP